MDTINQTTPLQSNDLFEPQRRGLPGTLNVLTILTFIGCGFAYLMGIYSLYDSSNYDKKMAEFEKAQEQIGDSEMANEMLQSSIDIFQKTYDYRYIIFISTILFTTLCLIGALQMRKLKKSGFTLYSIGELAPLVISAALLGFSLVGGIILTITAIIALLFVILYATQRKYMVN
jgi:hypothetical protein